MRFTGLQVSMNRARLPSPTERYMCISLYHTTHGPMSSHTCFGFGLRQLYAAEPGAPSSWPFSMQHADQQKPRIGELRYAERV